jgi:hypothetical protein
VSAARIATPLISQLRSIAMTLLCARSLNVAVPGSGPRKSRRAGSRGRGCCWLCAAGVHSSLRDDLCGFRSSRRGLPAEQLGILVAFAIFVLTETWLVPFEGYLIEKFGPRVMISISGVPRCLWSASLATCRAAM